MNLLRKLVALFLLIGIVLSFSFTSYAEDIDLSGYTDDEILILNEKIQQEIVSRGIRATAEVNMGNYTGGKDLPAGRYDMTLLERDLFSTVTVFLAGSTDYSFYTYPDEDDIGKQWSIVIADGDVLQVKNCKISLTISSGLVFK